MLLFEVGGNKRTTKTFDKWLTSFTPRVATMTMSYLTMCVCGDWWHSQNYLQ